MIALIANMSRTLTAQRMMTQSVIELEGDELEENLAGLRKELEELEKQTPYEKVVAASSMSASTFDIVR